MKASRHLKKPNFEDKYLLLERLGSGSFTAIYQCKFKRAEADDPSPQMKAPVAVKVFVKSNNCCIFRTESEIWSSVAPHENCVMMLESFEEDPFFYIVMEKCSVSLAHAFRWHALNHKRPKEQDSKHVCKGMLSGVNHLHECGIAHRDVRPANILLEKGHTLFGQPLVKLCDFGFATKVSDLGSFSEVSGTAPYMAPEMLLLKRYDTKVDVWSCGVIAYLMILDALPYGEGCVDMKEMKRLIRSGEVLPTFKAANNSKQPSHEAVQFLDSLLNRDPEERPSAKRVLTSAYMYLDSSTSSLKIHSAQSKQQQQQRRYKSITMQALCLEFPYSIHFDGSRLQRHSDAEAPTHAVADDIMKAPSNEVHDFARKVNDDLKSLASCSTQDDGDGVESVVSDESSTCNETCMFNTVHDTVRQNPRLAYSE